MKTILRLEGDGGDSLDVIREALAGELTRLDLALELANRRLRKYERKHLMSSEDFIHSHAAEDLVGADEEYVAWAGEYRLRERLAEKIRRLREVEYAPA